MYLKIQIEDMVSILLIFFSYWNALTRFNKCFINFFLIKWSLAICEYHSLRIQNVIHWRTCITPSFMWYFSVDVHSTGRPGDDVVRGRRSARSRRRRWRSMSHQRLKINRSRTFHNMKRHEIEIVIFYISC